MNLDNQVIDDPVYDCAAFADIWEKWPLAIRTDASDMVHPDRILVTIPGVTYREYYLHALDTGDHVVSLSFQFLLMNASGEPEFSELVNSWIKENNK